jgi:hypothetical protein
MGALRVEARGQRSRTLDAFVLGGDHGYGAVRADAGFEFAFAWTTWRPAAQIGWTSDDAPLDEWPALGGPTQLAGLRGDEWLGPRAAAVELRALRRFLPGVELQIAAQAGYVDEPIGGSALGERVRFAGDLGFRSNVPFGPLAVDAGWSEGGRTRLYLSFGQDF